MTDESGTPEQASIATVDMNGISLEQALKDFEIANARVRDLTRRLLESEQERRRLQNELEQLRLRLGGAPDTMSTRAQELATTATALARKVYRKLRSR